MGWLLRMFFQVSVPFFFILSGWLLGRKLAQTQAVSPVLLRSSRRLLQVYLPWFVLFCLLDAVQGRPVGIWPTIRRLTGFSDGSFTTSGYHLWFLPCLLLAQAAICWEYSRTRRVWASLLCGVFLYGLQAHLDATDVSLPFGLVRHEGLNISLLCVAIGVWLAIRPVTTRQFLPPNAMLVGILSCFLVLEGVIFIIANDKPWFVPGFTIARIVLATTIIQLLIQSNYEKTSNSLKSSLLDILARNSTVIYVVHVFFLEVIPFRTLPISGFVRDNLVRWPLVLLACLMTGTILRNSKFKFLRDVAT